MKKIRLIICGVLALALTACHKDEPNNGTIGNETNDTTEMVAKKYLVGVYLAGDTIVPMRIIDWNEDFTRINHITTFTSGSPSCQLDHDFEYYGDDSICIFVSQPPHQWNWPLFTRCTCRLEDGKIVEAEYYHNSNLQSTDYFEYDDSGRLITSRNAAGYDDSEITLQYVWDGENVSKIVNVTTGEVVEDFGDFCEHIHPDYTLPYMLHNGEFGWLMRPLWKNFSTSSDGCHHECDSDGYVISSYRVDENGNEIPLRVYVYAESNN